VLTRLLSARAFSVDVERVLFALTANRALSPVSKLSACDWVTQEAVIPGLPTLSPDHCYRAMDFLLEAEAEIQKEVFFSVADLLSLEVDLILFDTTSTYFECPEADDFRRYGHSKDRREDRPQTVIGLAVTREGIPVRVLTFPGNASDQLIIRHVKQELSDWKLGQVVFVADGGFASEENRRLLSRAGSHYLFAEKLRGSRDAKETLSRGGRYQVVEENLRVKEVLVRTEKGIRRYVVCFNPEEATKDRLTRERHLSELATALAAGRRKKGNARTRSEAELLTHPVYGRYLTQQPDGLALNQQKAKDEARLDGKYLLSTSDDTMTAAEMALAYKHLQEVERSWRDLKQVLEIRPIYHRKEERIRAHVLLCYLALLLVRVVETRTRTPWRRLRRELDHMRLGEFAGKTGRVKRRTETTAEQKRIFNALKLKEPALVYKIQAKETV